MNVIYRLKVENSAKDGSEIPIVYRVLPFLSLTKSNNKQKPRNTTEAKPCIMNDAQVEFSNNCCEAASFQSTISIEKFGSITSENELDLERGKRESPLVRDQSKRFSRLLQSQTELFHLQNNEQQPQTEQQQRERNKKEEESSGIRYWINELETAQEHGGDCKPRFQAALRATLGSLTVFSALVFPEQQCFLGAVWIGNIFMHASIKSSLGSSLVTVRDFAAGILLTTAVSYPMATFLDSLDTIQGCLLLPFLVFCMTFLIMSSPQVSFSIMRCWDKQYSSCSRYSLSPSIVSWHRGILWS